MRPNWWACCGLWPRPAARSGDLPSALHLYQRADLIVEQSRANIERQVLVAHYRGLGNLQLELGDLPAARAALNAGIDAAADDATLTVERGYLLLALARATRRSRSRATPGCSNRRWHCFSRDFPGRIPLNLRVVNELCAVEIAARADPASRCKEAGDWVLSARDVEPTLRSAVYQNESALDEIRGDLNGAYAQALKSVAAAEAVGTPDPLWRAYFTFAAANAARRDTGSGDFFWQASGQPDRAPARRFHGQRARSAAHISDRQGIGVPSGGGLADGSLAVSTKAWRCSSFSRGRNCTTFSCAGGGILERHACRLHEGRASTARALRGGANGAG